MRTFERYKLMCRFLHQWTITGLLNTDGTLTVANIAPNDPHYAEKIEHLTRCPICKEEPVQSQKMIIEWEDL